MARDARCGEVYIAIGSNIEPRRHIPEALRLLARHVRVLAVSTMYRTPPAGGRDQPDFVNGVCRVESHIPPRQLKEEVLRPIEAQLGRVRTKDKYDSRTIDLDVIIYGELVLDEPGLRIPDPDVRQRPFMAVPLLELAPALTLPDTGEPLAGVEAIRSAGNMTKLEKLTDLLRARIET